MISRLTEKQRTTVGTLLFLSLVVSGLYLDFNLNAAGELELHQGVNGLSR